MKNYAGDDIKFTGCPGCAYAKHEFELPCGMAYENGRFTVSQDWELPIEGFYVVCPTMRHVEHLVELNSEERSELFTLVSDVITILKQNKVCDSFNIVIQEKAGVHLHVWIYPQHYWISSTFGDSMANVKAVFDYAKANFRTKECIEKINTINQVVKIAMNAKYSK